MEAGDGEGLAWQSGGLADAVFGGLAAQDPDAGVSGLYRRSDRPGDRKSVQPMAGRAGDVGYDQLHHFVAAGVWDSAPLEAVLLKEADRLVGDDAGYLVIDDTALPEKGQHLVGVAPQYASSLGKTSNCQSLVSSAVRLRSR